MKTLAGNHRVTHYSRGGIIVSGSHILHSDIAVKYTQLPLVIGRETFPLEVHRVLLLCRLLEIIGLHTGGVFQLDIINQHVAGDDRRAQTGRERDIIIRQLIVAQDQSHFLELASSGITDCIERNERALVVDIPHRTYI